MNAHSTSFQQFLEERIKAALFHQAQVQVEIALDVEECDLPRRIKAMRDLTIEECISGMVQMSVDYLIDNDVEPDGVIKLDREKMIQVAERIAAEATTSAFLAQCALIMRGYKLSRQTHTLLVQHIGLTYTEN